jgi:cell division transport system ATP-binding protein
MIQFTNVSKIYPNGFQALNTVTFSVKAGELVLLTGPSGSGKTTLFKLLLRLTSPSHGFIFVNKRNIAQLKKSQLPHLRRYIGVVSQNSQLIPNLSIFDNVALPLLIEGYRADYVNTRVKAALKKVGLLDKSHLQAMDMSSGEQKRTEVARAVITTPKILLVDEPTANVDATTAIEMLSLLKAFNNVGMTVLIATHQSHLLNGKETRSFIIKNGCLQSRNHHVIQTA